MNTDRDIESVDDYISSGLILHYDGINNTGSGHSDTATVWKDLTGNNNDGVITGYSAGDWTSKGQRFNTTKYIDIPFNLVNTQDFTIEAVCDVDVISDATVGGIINKHNGLDYRVSFIHVEGVSALVPKVQIASFKNNGGANTADSYMLTGALPIAGEIFSASNVNQSKNGRLYYKGELKNSKAGYYNVQFNTCALRIGRSANSGVALNGTIYSIRIYDRALSDNEIKYNYNTDKTRFNIAESKGIPCKVSEKARAGDYVLYNPDSSTDSYVVDGSRSTSTPGNSTANQTHTRESLKWRVLDVKGDQVRLISVAPTAFGLTLQGANGYNNAVKLIDDLCAIYGGSKGTAKGLKIEDIEEYVKEKNYKNILTDYGTTWTPTNKNYPLIFAKENKQFGNGATGYFGLSEQDNNWYTGTTTVGTLNVVYTYWYKTMASGDWTNSKYHELFINNGSNYPVYWLSSRCVMCFATHSGFNGRCVGNGGVDAIWLYYSNNSSNSATYRVRPVVTLNSNIQVIGGNGIDGWIIK